MTISVRDTIQARFPDIDLANGIRQLLNDAYTTAPDAYPYLEGGAISLRRMVESFRWWTSYTESSEHPTVTSQTQYSNQSQGVSHGGSARWFFSQNNADKVVWQYPVSHDIATNVGNPQEDYDYCRFVLAYPPGGYDHLGAIAVHGKYVFAAVENGTPAIVIIATYDLADDPPWTRLGYAELSEQTALSSSAPWCAINPQNEMLYSSGYNHPNAGPSELLIHTYRVDWDYLDPPDPQTALIHVGSLTLSDPDGNPLVLEAVQGGAFSPSGHLYLSVWFPSDESRRGIYGFDMTSGRQVVFIGPIDTAATSRDRELEGLAIWDYDAVRAGDPGADTSVGGQIHLLIVQTLAIDWPMGMKHFRIPLGEREFL